MPVNALQPYSESLNAFTTTLSLTVGTVKPEHDIVESTPATKTRIDCTRHQQLAPVSNLSSTTRPRAQPLANKVAIMGRGRPGRAAAKNAAAALSRHNSTTHPCNVEF